MQHPKRSQAITAIQVEEVAAVMVAEAAVADLVHLNQAH